MRRLTRLTNAFSKMWEKPYVMLALYFAWYNFCRIHQTLRVALLWNQELQTTCGQSNKCLVESA
jgi:hypothetical protein